MVMGHTRAEFAEVMARFRSLSVTLGLEVGRGTVGNGQLA